MPIISQTEAARALGVNKSYLTELKNRKTKPLYFVKNAAGNWRIDTDTDAWRMALQKKNRKAKEDKEEEIKNILPENLLVQAEIADMQKRIHDAEFKAEKAKQEKIKTLELKKDLAPVLLVKHFFSFSENLIQRLYRRPHEISPQLSALYLASEDKKAVQLITREIEGIIKDVQKQLIADMENEGFKTDDYKKKIKGGKK